MMLGLLGIPMTGWSEGKCRHVADAVLGVDFFGMKAKGGWTAVVIALQNHAMRATSRGLTDGRWVTLQFPSV